MTICWYELDAKARKLKLAELIDRIKLSLDDYFRASVYYRNDNFIYNLPYFHITCEEQTERGIYLLQVKILTDQDRQQLNQLKQVKTFEYYIEKDYTNEPETNNPN